MITLPAKLARLLALVLVLLGFGLRLHNLGVESLWYDELLQVNLALDDIPRLLSRLPFHAALPLDYLVSHYWIFLGNGDFWVRVPAVVLGTLTLPAIFQLGRIFLGTSMALLLMALFTVSPFHLRYSQEVRPYALGILGVTLFSYFVWQIRAGGGWRYLLPLQLAALMFSLSHFFANVIFGPWLLFLGLDVVFNRHRKHSVNALTGVVTVGVVCLLVLLLLGWGPTLFKVADTFGESLINTEQFNTVPEEKPNEGQGPKVDFGFIRHAVIAPLGAGGTAYSFYLFSTLVILGLISLVVQKQYKLGLLLSLWVIVPIAGVLAFLVHRGTFFAPRYIIFVLPAYFTLLAVGIGAIPRLLLHRLGTRWVAIPVFLLIAGAVFVDLNNDVGKIYRNKDKEDWRLVGKFIENNAGPDDAVIAVKAEPVLSWYYPPSTAPGNLYSELEVIQEKVAQAKRSWVVLSVYSSGIDHNIKLWLGDGEQGSIRFDLDPIISVYYLGHNAGKDELRQEVQSFALPKNHAIYANLARENRHQPDVARRYFQLAIENAPNEQYRAYYQSELEKYVGD